MSEATIAVTCTPTNKKVVMFKTPKGASNVIADDAEAVLADPTLTERQKQVLLDIYQSFRREHDSSPEEE